uniref:ARAD1C12210p n=1 Tax=Blastobotrys adeninivorans TaxID=409370 RepID=A0A060T0Y9_BLAAD
MSIPRPSASLVVVAQNQLLFMRRPTRGTFPSMHVFPGGVVEKGDPGPSYCALRETYEETGLLISPHLKDGPVVLPQEEGSHSYEAAVEHLTGKNAKDGVDWSDPESFGLRPISKWITPTTAPKRFEAQFYVYSIPAPFPVSHIKNREVELLEWLSPSQALDNFKAGKLSFMPPQFYIITAILEKGVQGAVDALRNRTFRPAPKRKFKDGRLELDWGQGESGIVTTDKTSGWISSIEYIRSNL